jgi:hypothetical protein
MADVGVGLGIDGVWPGLGDGGALFGGSGHWRRETSARSLGLRVLWRSGSAVRIRQDALINGCLPNDGLHFSIGSGACDPTPT